MTEHGHGTQRADDSDPLDQFSDCHAGIMRKLQALGELPALAEAAARARRSAEATLRFFDDVIYEHHAQEEQELFPAVLASAVAGEEHDRVRGIVEQLTREHREVEATWAKLAPALKAIAKGRDASFDAAAIEALVQRYRAHAAFEESEFLPLSETILGRDSQHKAALGLSLHMRHAVPDALARFPARI